MTSTERPSRDSLDERSHARTSLGRAAVWGLALFLTTTGTFAPESAPEAGAATAAEIRAFAVDNATTLRINMIAGVLSIGLLVAFVGELGRLIRCSRDESVAREAMSVVVGVIAANTLVVTAVASIFGRPVELATASDRTVLAIYDVLATTEWLYTLVVVGPCMLLVGMASWLLLRHRLLARGVCWAGLVLVVIGLVSLVSLALPDFGFDPFVIAVFGWWLWPLALSGAAGARWWRTRHRDPHAEDSSASDVAAPASSSAR